MIDPITAAAIRQARSALDLAIVPSKFGEFSLAAMLRAKMSDTWTKQPSKELLVSRALHQQYGVPQVGERVPDDALMLRDAIAAVASAGGYLTDTQHLGYVDAAKPAMVTGQLGASVVTAGPAGGAVVPKGSTPPTMTWLASETAVIAESTPAFTQVASTPKLLGGFVEISRQALLQSNAEQIVRLELRNAAGVALDAAVLAGSGASGQPTGITDTAGINTFTGAALSQAAARNAQKKVSDANSMINRNALGYATTPTVAEILSTRQRFTGSSTCLWEGSSDDGEMEGCRALATTGCPATTVIYGDWSGVFVVQWNGGLTIEADPYTKFNQGIVGVRLLMQVDIIVARPASFAVATSVS